MFLVSCSVSCSVLCSVPCLFWYSVLYSAQSLVLSYASYVITLCNVCSSDKNCVGSQFRKNKSRNCLMIYKNSIQNESETFISTMIAPVYRNGNIHSLWNVLYFLYLYFFIYVLIVLVTTRFLIYK